MLMNGKKPIVKYTRHRKAPSTKSGFEMYSMKFSTLLEDMGFDSDRYFEIIKNVLLDSRNIHHSCALPEDDLNYLKKVIYTLAVYGFQYQQIEYLTLYGVGAKRASVWVKKYIGDKPFLQKNIVIGIYSTLIEKTAFREIKQTNKKEDLLTQIMEEEVIMFSYNFDNKKMRPVSFLTATKEKESNRKK